MATRFFHKRKVLNGPGSSVDSTVGMQVTLRSTPGPRQEHYFVKHYANMPMQYIAIFHDCENGNFSVKKKVIFFLFLLKTLIVVTR